MGSEKSGCNQAQRLFEMSPKDSQKCRKGIPKGSVVGNHEGRNGLMEKAEEKKLGLWGAKGKTAVKKVF